MNLTYEKAMKEMDFLVEKMQLALPEESYRIQCVWEIIKTSDKAGWDDALDEAWDEGYKVGKNAGYEHGYDKGYRQAQRDGYTKGGE